MKLRRRTNGIWLVETTHPRTGKRVRLSTGEKDRKAAEREAVKILAALESGKLDGVKFRDVLWHTYRERWASKKSARTFAERAKQLDRHLGDLLVSEIRYSTLVELVKRLQEEGDAPATINRKLSAVSTALKEAVKLEYLSKVPPLPRQKEDNKKDRFLTEEEEEALLNACLMKPARKMESPGPFMKRWRQTATYMRRLLPFLLDTGARLGESQRIDGSCITEVGGQPVVMFYKTKSDKPRVVPLTPRAYKCARKMVIHPLHGKLSTWGLIARFNRIRRQAGVSPEVTLHTMRHTCASRLIQRGVPITVVRDWLGHSSVTVTERYAHLAPARSLTDAMRVLCRP